MPKPLENDRFFLDRWGHDDERAFIEIYDHYWYKLFRSAYRRIKDKSVAEELVQNLFLKLWEKRGTLKSINWRIIYSRPFGMLPSIF